MLRSISDEQTEIVARLNELAQIRPTKMDASKISRFKIPGIAMWCRYTMIWRFTELAQAAMDCLEQEHFAAAMVLTRAAVETGASLWYLYVNIGKAIETERVQEFGEKLRKLTIGYKEPGALEDFPEAINVLTFIDHVDKKCPGFARAYATLCEYAHPNHQGAAGLFSRPYPESGLVEFGSNIRESQSHGRICVSNLGAAVIMFEFSYKATEALVQKLAIVCEKNGTP